MPRSLGNTLVFSGAGTKYDPPVAGIKAWAYSLMGLGVKNNNSSSVTCDVHSQGGIKDNSAMPAVVGVASSFTPPTAGTSFSDTFPGTAQTIVAAPASYVVPQPYNPYSSEAAFGGSETDWVDTLLVQTGIAAGFEGLITPGSGAVDDNGRIAADWPYYRAKIV